MNIKLPFLPVRGEEEYRLLERFVLLVSPNLDFEKMAIKWCGYVDGIAIFQKLPVYLQTHHTLWSRNQQVRDAVENAQNGERVLHAMNASTAPKRTLQLAHAPTHEPTPSPTTVSIPTTEPTFESRNWAIPTMPITMQQAPVSMQMQQSINMSIVAGVVIEGAPVTATSTTNLRGNDKKRRKKHTCNYCLANGKE